MYLERIQTTSERNGYPRSIKSAFIGFKAFEEAERFAEKYHGEIISFHKKDGWQFYSRGDKMCESFTINPYKDFGVEEYEGASDEIKYLLDSFSTADTASDLARMKEAISNLLECEEEYQNKQDDEMVLVGENWEHFATMKEHPMSYYYDTNYYVIGVIDADEEEVFADAIKISNNEKFLIIE